MEGDGKGNFKSRLAGETGFVIEGDGKSLTSILVAEELRMQINNNSLKCYEHKPEQKKTYNK